MVSGVKPGEESTCTGCLRGRPTTTASQSVAEEGNCSYLSFTEIYAGPAPEVALQMGRVILARLGDFNENGECFSGPLHQSAIAKHQVPLVIMIYLMIPIIP